MTRSCTGEPAPRWVRLLVVGGLVLGAVLGGGCGAFLRKFVRPPSRAAKPVQALSVAPEARGATDYQESFFLWRVRQDALWEALEDGSRKRRMHAAARVRESLGQLGDLVPDDQRARFEEVRRAVADVTARLGARRLGRAELAALRQRLRTCERMVMVTWAPERVAARQAGGGTTAVMATSSALDP